MGRGTPARFLLENVEFQNYVMSHEYVSISQVSTSDPVLSPWEQSQRHVVSHTLQLRSNISITPVTPVVPPPFLQAAVGLGLGRLALRPRVAARPEAEEWVVLGGVPSRRYIWAWQRARISSGMLAVRLEDSHQQ